MNKIILNIVFVSLTLGSFATKISFDNKVE